MVVVKGRVGWADLGKGRFQRVSAVTQRRSLIGGWPRNKEPPNTGTRATGSKSSHGKGNGRGEAIFSFKLETDPV
jgi:hypothetical protein